MKTIFLIHLTATLMMTGVIWFVQVIHYPLFHQIPTESFPTFEIQHQKLTGMLVAPLMLIELGTAIWLIGMRESSFSLLWLGANLGLLLLLWASTFFIQVPLHGSLGQEFSTENIQKLVNSNWIRTVLWSLRAGLLIFLLHES